MNPQKHKTPKKYRQFALVTFRGPFPIDALRYDRAYPFTESDGRQIEDSHFQIVVDTNGNIVRGGEEIKLRQVIVCQDTESAPAQWSAYVWEGSGVKLHPIGYEEAEAIRHEQENIPPRLQYEELNKPVLDPATVRQLLSQAIRLIGSGGTITANAEFVKEAQKVLRGK